MVELELGKKTDTGDSEGNIIEQGTHESLMKQNGFYAELYNSQFEKDEAI